MGQLKVISSLTGRPRPVPQKLEGRSKTAAELTCQSPAAASQSSDHAVRSPTMIAAAAPTRPCHRCGHPVRADKLVAGKYGSDCAELLGLTGTTVDVGQDGPDLLDVLADDIGPDDECDGCDRPADRP